MTTPALPPGNPPEVRSSLLITARKDEHALADSNGHPSRQEIIEPDPAEPAYNDPTLSPKDFLLAVMRDRRLPLAARIEAATKVSVYEHARLAQITQDMTIGATIRIEGGLPLLPGTNIIMPDADVSSTTSASMPPKKGNGHDPST